MLCRFASPSRVEKLWVLLVIIGLVNQKSIPGTPIFAADMPKKILAKKKKLEESVLCYFPKTDKFILRRPPSVYEQTEGTIAAQSSFALASRIGKTLRGQLAPVIPFPKDRAMQIAFSGALSSWLRAREDGRLLPTGNVAALENFSFNRSSPLHQFLAFPFELTQGAENSVIIKLPAFVPGRDIRMPEGTVSLEWRIVAATVDLTDGTAVAQFQTDLGIPLIDEQIPPGDIRLNIQLEPGQLIVCGMQIFFYQSFGENQTPINDPAYMPAGVIGAIYS